MAQDIFNFSNVDKSGHTEFGLHILPKMFFKWANLGLYFIYFCSFQTNNTIFTTNQCEKFMSIQYMAPGFEPTTS